MKIFYYFLLTTCYYHIAMNFTENLQQKLKWYYENTMEPEKWCPYNILYHPETGLLSVDNYVISNMDSTTQQLWLHKLTSRNNHIWEDEILAIVARIPDDIIPNLIRETHRLVLLNSGNDLPYDTMQFNESDTTFNESDTTELLNLHKNVIEKKIKLFS